MFVRLETRSLELVGEGDTLQLPGKNNVTLPIMLEIDGEGLEPDTVDPLVALELAGRYFDLLQISAEAHNVDLDLKGLKVVNKCVGIEVMTTRPIAEVKRAIVATGAAIQGQQAIAGTGDRVKRLRKALNRVPYAKVQLGDWIQELRAADETRSRHFEVLSLRAYVLRVGGKKPTARFSSGSEDKDFTLSIHDENQAKQLGEHLYENIDVVAQVQRDFDGHIIQGVFVSFTPVERGDAFEAWRTWFQDAAPEWNNVEDIDGELGRDDVG